MKILALDLIYDISTLECKDREYNRNVEIPLPTTAASCPRRIESSCRIYLHCVCSLSGGALVNLQLPVLINEIHILLEIINK